MNRTYQKSFLHQKNAGFTLIELLVVVLIIGILAAVAVPQYQLAVEKAYAAEALANGRRLQKAQNLYLLESGTMPDSLDDLSIPRPMSNYFSYSIISGHNSIQILRRKTTANYWFEFIPIESKSGPKGRIYCAIRVDSNLGNKVCQSVSIRFDHRTGSINYYLLSE